METVLHYDDIKKIDWRKARPPVGWDVYVLFMDEYESKALLTEAALKTGYLLGLEERRRGQ